MRNPLLPWRARTFGLRLRFEYLLLFKNLLEIVFDTCHQDKNCLLSVVRMDRGDVFRVDSIGLDKKRVVHQHHFNRLLVSLVQNDASDIVLLSV